MQKKERKRTHIKRALAALSLISLLLSALLVLGSCALGRISDREELREYVNTHEADSRANNIAAIFDAWRFPRFNAARVAALEAAYIDNYYLDLPPRAELAKEAAEIFLDEYFDGCDLNDSDSVADGIIHSYIKAVGDKYSVYRNAAEAAEYRNSLSGERGGIGVTVKYEAEDCDGVYITEVEKNSPAAAAGLAAGDFITEVDGVKMSEVGYSKTTDMIAGEIGSTVRITVLRDGAQMDFTVARAIITVTSVNFYMLEGELSDIAYIQIRSFNKNTHLQFKDAIDAARAADASGIIFDLTVNPGGYLSSVVSMLSYLVPTGTPIASFSGDREGEFATAGGEFEPTDSVLDIPSVVLITENTASAAELFAAALLDYDEMDILSSTVIGRVSYKKGVMQRTFVFDNGDTVTMTTSYYNPPLGENFNGVGVIPDVLVEGNEGWLEIATAELRELIA